MLYYLFRLLDEYHIPGSHMWSYVSFRAILTLILALLISAWFGERFIKWMKRRKIFETERVLGRIRNIYLILMIITTVWLGFLGFLDDYIKIFRRNKDGLKGKWKIVGQVSIGFIVGLTLWLSPDAVVRENVSVKQQNQEMVVKHKSEAVKSLQTTIPFFKNHNLNYSDIMSFCGEYKVAAGWMLFVFITIFVVTGISNGANLNDGMDGMCAGNSAIIGIALGILAYVSSSVPSSVP